MFIGVYPWLLSSNCLPQISESGQGLGLADLPRGHERRDFVQLESDTQSAANGRVSGNRQF